jgi:muramoyltetrapeptide carboxypeptidase
MNVLHPPLEKGDTIGLAAPAGRLQTTTSFYEGVRYLEEMGFKTKFPRELWPGDGGYLADSDSKRALELNTLYADPTVTAILAVRGGFGSLRMLPYLDLRPIRKSRKPLMGFSDISILLNYLSRTCGVPCWHGPTLCSLSKTSREVSEAVFRVLVGRWNGELHLPQLEILQQGEHTQGRIYGGNLASLVSCLGTPYDISWENAVLLFEDINEPLYRIDRLLTQLFQAGKLQRVKAILLGDFGVTGEQNRIESLRYREAVWRRFSEVVDPRCTIWANIPSGHCQENMPWPVGAEVFLDQNRGTIRISEV